MDAFSSSISPRFKCICCRSYGPGLRWVFSIFCVTVPYTVPTYVSLFTPWSRLFIITATICSQLLGRNWKGSGYCLDFYRISLFHPTLFPLIDVSHLLLLSFTVAHKHKVTFPKTCIHRLIEKYWTVWTEMAQALCNCHMTCKADRHINCRRESTTAAWKARRLKLCLRNLIMMCLCIKM